MHRYFNREYAVGERHKIEWEIKTNNSADIAVVTNARYEIIKNGKLTEHGEASVDSKTISCLFTAAEKGCYVVRVFVTVPPETISSELYIDVTE